MTNTNRHCEARKSCGNLNRILSIILAAILLTSVFTVFPLTVSAADVDTAESGARQVIQVVNATSDIGDMIFWGDIKRPYFSNIDNENVSFPEFNSYDNASYWMKWIDGEWREVEMSRFPNLEKEYGKFSNGLWRQVIVLYTSDHNYMIGEDTKVIIDGNEWNSMGDLTFGDAWSYQSYYNDYTISGKTELTFHNIFNESIDATVAGKAITPFSVASAASGGDGYYSFSKVRGPEWLTVSYDGVVSGTPDKGYVATKLVVRVYDGERNTAEISINVPAVTVDPADRQVITVVRAKSNMEEIAVNGGEIQDVTFDIKEGWPTQIPENMGRWFQKVDGEWQLIDSGTFTPGEWKYNIQVRTGDPNYQLSDDTKVIIDGEEWVKDGVTYVGDTFSFVFFDKEITIYPPCSVTFTHPDGGIGTMAPVTVNKGTYYTLPECTFIPPVGKRFKGWLFDGTVYQPNDKILINGDTVLTAEWKDVCTVTFNSNGGSGTMDSVTVDKGSTYELPACTFSPPEGKLFDKWQVGLFNSNAPGDKITVNNNTTVRAIWKSAPSNTYSISGTATSFLEESDNTTIELSKKSGENYAFQGIRGVSGNSGSYSFTGLSNGQYKLSVRKMNHVTREYNVTILLGSKTQDVTINPKGDVDGNGKVQAADAMKAYQHAQGKADAQLTDYAFLCADVAPVGEPNGKVQAADAMVIYQQAQGKHSLF